MYNRAIQRRGLSERQLERDTKWPFVAMCSYLAAQAFMVPLVAKGPWAVWPTFADIAFGFILLTGIIGWRQLNARSQANDVFGRFFFFAVGSCVASFTLLVIFPFLQNLTSAKMQEDIVYGVYQSYRLVQFAIIYLIARRIPLTNRRMVTLCKLCVAVLVLVCAGIIWSYFSPELQRICSVHLPHGMSSGGAWYDYSTFPGLGTISYNHGYVAMQVMILLGFAIHFTPNGNRWYISLLLALALAAVFFSGSRAGMIGTAFYALCLYVQRPRYLIVGFGLLALVLSILPARYFDEMIPAIKRGTSISSSYGSDGFAGRDQIWHYTWVMVQEHPELLVYGVGFGAVGIRDAHNNYLQVVFEFGIIGLSFFLALFYTVLKYLYRYETGLRSLFWTTVALLITAATQETFYPVVSFGHFIGIFVLVLAIAFQKPQVPDDEQAQRQQHQRHQITPVNRQVAKELSLQ